jgi:hypothetical protein
MRIGMIGLALLASCTLGCDSTPTGEVFIALNGDFAPFRTWSRVFVGDGPLDGHPAGPRYGYVKQKPPAGATEYPVGSIIVKTVERGTTPQEWDIFAMAKRGGQFNSAGASNWEFFTLKITAGDVPLIVSRGTNPVDADADGGAGGSYQDTSGTGVTCNRCHGLAGTERSDHILSPLLIPGAP